MTPSTKKTIEAEKLNGRLAMIGVIAGIVSYVFTGHILPGVF